MKILKVKDWIKEKKYQELANKKYEELTREERGVLFELRGKLYGKLNIKDIEYLKKKLFTSLQVPIKFQ